MPSVFLVFGFASVVLQAVLVREMLAVFYGSELIIGVIFGSWLAWIGVGAMVGGRVAKDFSFVRPAFLFSMFLFAVLPFGQVVLIRTVRVLLYVPVGEMIPLVSTLLFCAGAVSLPSFIIGFVFPLGSGWYLRGERRLRGGGDVARGVGWLYVCESLGFLVGGVAFTFVFAGRFGSFEVLGVSFVVLAFAFLLLAARSTVDGLVGSAVVVVIVAALFSVIDDLDERTVAARWKSISPATRLIGTVDSKYENISLSEEAGQYSVYGNGRYRFSFPDPYHYKKLAHFALAQHPLPDRVLVLGGGAVELACEMLVQPIESLDYVALDEKLLAAVLPYLDDTTRKCLDDPRLQMKFTDGRFFVRSAEEKYDLIFVDSSNPSTAAQNRYFTLEFFREAKAALREGGVVASNIVASENLLPGVAGAQTASLYKTIGRVFEHVAVIPGETHYYFASDAPGVVTTEVAELERRHARRNVPSEHFHPAMFATLVQPHRLAEVKESLEGKKFIRTNSDTNPSAYYYNLILWLSTLEAGGREGEGTAGFMMVVERRGFVTVLIIMVVFLGAGASGLVLSRKSSRQKRAGGALLSVFLCGFTAMSFEMLLIYYYQNLFGVLFERIALITGVFMVGIAGGGMFANALLKNGFSPVRQVKVIHALFAQFAFIVLFVIVRTTEGALAVEPIFSQLVFISLVFVCGLLTGWVFPVACALHLEGEGKVGRTAGRVDSFDHLGAACGAFLAGAFLIPVFGIHSLGALLISVNLGAFALWLILAQEYPG